MKTPGDIITVKIVYRNYKPLHKIYESLVVNPPKNVKYILPKTAGYLAKFFVLYRKYKRNKLIKKLIELVNKSVFSQNSPNEKFDILQFVNMTPGDLKQLNKPFIVDVERASSLTGFIEGKDSVKIAIQFLTHKNCRAVVCMSLAARESLKKLVGTSWSQIKDKVEIIYPTIPLPNISAGNRSIIKSSNKLNLLFVGNQSGRKGLPDLLVAIKNLNKKYANKFMLYVVSNDAGPLLDKYNFNNVILLEPNFSKEEMLKQLFIPADVFVFPTRGDTYGLAAVDALASGTPIIATKQFALPEIIEDGKDGRLITLKEPALDKYLFLPKRVVDYINSQNTLMPGVADQLEQIIEGIINDRSVLKNWSMNARKKFGGNNILSIARRNDQYRKLYQRILS